MGEYYSRDGKPLTSAEWSASFGGDRHVGDTKLASGYWVSTVWLGLNHAFGDGPPLIFETMVFPTDADGNVTAWGELEGVRYSTEAEAVAGHARMVDRWTNGQPVSDDAVDPVAANQHELTTRD